MTSIFHLALARDWEQAQRTGSYTVSTRDRSLAEVGFIHASRADQWTGVRDRFYADVTDPMVLLQIDTDLLDVPVVEEAAADTGETFPHIYGPLPVAAVRKAIPLDRRVAAPLPTPRPAGPPATEAPSQGAQESFTRTYFREVSFNVAMVCLVLLAGTAGMALGGWVGDDRGPGVGGVLGVALGVVVAATTYRRRHPRADD